MTWRKRKKKKHNKSKNQQTLKSLASLNITPESNQDCDTGKERASFESTSIKDVRTVDRGSTSWPTATNNVLETIWSSDLRSRDVLRPFLALTFGYDMIFAGHAMGTALNNSFELSDNVAGDLVPKQAPCIHLGCIVSAFFSHLRKSFCENLAAASKGRTGACRRVLVGQGRGVDRTRKVVMRCQAVVKRRCHTEQLLSFLVFSGNGERVMELVER
jgi:hypothetical protein